MQTLKRAKVVFISTLVFALLAAGGAGFWIGRNSVSTVDARFSGADFSLFWEAYRELKEGYVGEIDPQKFVYGAITGAYQSLGDPYTTFLSPELTDQFQEELSGQLEGIGLKLGMLNDLPTVISPIDNSPAQKAGIKSKDVILKVDDFETQAQSLDLVVSKIRGEAGTKVKLLIKPNNSSEIKEVELTREKIEVSSVEVEYEGDIAIISIGEFSSDTSSEFEKSYQEAKQKGVKKVILDLRANPGGLLNSAIEMAEYFLPKDKTIVIEQNKKGKTETKVETERGWKDIKLVVLVDGGSASASEILAGALKDHDRAKLIGEKTFGKGLVQELVSLKEGSSAKITVSKWLTPKGNDIDKNGISPDIEVKTPEDQNFSSDDPVINRAKQAF